MLLAESTAEFTRAVANNSGGRVLAPLAAAYGTGTSPFLLPQDFDNDYEISVDRGLAENFTFYD